jgi:hypothetical protein
MKLKQLRFTKACLVLILCFSILPEAVFSFEDTFDKVEIGSASSEGTNSCNEHHCPVVPNQPCQHCPVCCTVSHHFTNQSTGIIFHFNNSSQPFSIAEDVLDKELFAKKLFRPPQSIL